MSTKTAVGAAFTAVLLGCSADATPAGDGATTDIVLIDASDTPDSGSDDVVMAVDDRPMAISDVGMSVDVTVVAACGVCATPAEPETSGTTSAAELDEMSGIVESRAQPGVYFVHNDSGDTARFFAIDGTGALRGTYVLMGATAVDWEDIAVGPCPTGECVYLGDIGDNNLARSELAVYRVPQPVVGAGAAVQHPVEWERFTFVYPDGAHNAESLAVRPDTGDVYVITKKSSPPTEVFRFPMPLTADARATLVHVATLALPTEGDQQATGADVHPCARRLLVRSYNRLWQYEVAEGVAWEDIFRATPTRLLLQTEVQGEAIGWHSDGRGYVTISEGRTQGLHDARCPP